MELKKIEIEKPDEINFILGQSHFIKTIEDLYEAIVQTVPDAKFGIAFCEASGKRLIRYTGTSEKMIDLAIKNAKKIGAGHSFIIFLENLFPVNILNSIKNVTEVCRIFCATANPTDIIIYDDGEKRGILGVLDGFTPLGVENDEDKKWRKDIIRQFGYKEK